MSQLLIKFRLRTARTTNTSKNQEIIRKVEDETDEFIETISYLLIALIMFNYDSFQHQWEISNLCDSVTRNQKITKFSSKNSEKNDLFELVASKT